MTFNVYYTDRAQPDSAFVHRAWYDNKASRLALELHGVVYEYDSVPESVYDLLVTAGSPGTVYRNSVQGNYNGRRLGPVSELVETRVGHRALTPEPVPVTPLLEVQRIPLTPSEVKSQAPLALDYTLQFTLEHDGTESDERSHSLKATSLDDAIEQMLTLAETLDQSIVLKGASVRFE